MATESESINLENKTDEAILNDGNHLMTEIVHFDKISVHEGPKQSPGFLLWRVSTAWRTKIESTLKSFNLTHPQFVILAAIGWLTKNGATTTQAAIGKMVGLDPNTTSQVIMGLEKKGWIQREKSTDARAKSVSLTLQGISTLNLALPAVEETDAEFFGHLNPKEMGLQLKIFQKLSVIPTQK